MFRAVTITLFAILATECWADKPNILFIMSDDHTSQAIGAYESRLAKLNPTPTIDRLSREGVLFSNAFCTNSICSPSRACIITGQYAHTCGAYDLGAAIEPARQFLAHEMKKAGYETAMIGKWHLKKEPAAFDYYCVLPGQGKYHNPDFRVRGDNPWPKNTVTFKGKHSSDAITDITLKWLKERDSSKPFFLMHHYKAPHDFFEYAKRYEDYLADVDIPEPDNLWKRDEKFGSLATRGTNDELIPHIGTSIGRRNPRRSYAKHYKVSSELSDEDAKREAYNIYLKAYLRCVKGVDDNLKRLFAHLESTGQLDNTLIIYTGDQGFMLGEHDYQDKRWMYDESQRMPFLMRYPKSIPAGTRSDAIVENVDFAATMLDFAGVPTPDYMQGKSFRSIAETGNEPDDWKKAAYYRYWMHMAHHDNPGHVGIRTKTHKLIMYYGAGYRKGVPRTPPAWELYDLTNDPKENVNQYDNPKYASIASKMKQELKALRQRVGDTGADFPEIEKVIQDFWEYDDGDQAAARKISSEFLNHRKALLERMNRPKQRNKKQKNRFQPDQSKLPVPPPKGATILFDGKNRGFVSMKGNATNWPIKDGALISTPGGSNSNHLVSRFHFRDADIHVEFMTPAERPGNSGIYIHGNYEMQILNPRDKPLGMDDIGSLYGFSKPLVMAARAPGKWQVYDIRYRAPRRDKKGDIIEQGSITAWLNGKLVQDHTKFGEARSKFHPYRHGTTPYLQQIWTQQKDMMAGPVFLQDHNNPVKFRNVWIKPLDDKAFWYQPDK